MASNREYWLKRAQHRELISYTAGADVTAALLREYKKSAVTLRKEISDFYSRYADENGLTYEQAIRDMTRAELQEWRGTVGDYIEQIRREPNPQIRERLMREYDARAYNSRISRLDGLCGGIEMNINRLYARAEEQLRQLLGEEYTGGYYRAMYDLQTRLGYNGFFSTINAQMVEKTLSYPWSGANFSDRLWRNKTALVDTIRETLTQGMIRGDSIRDMSRNVADKLNSSYRNAECLVRTETSHIHNTAELAAYEAAGYEEYEYMASLGERTCEVCGGLDGQHFKLTDIQYGVNFPPVHPRCRCTTVGWDPEEKELPEGEQQEKLSYEDWYGKYVEGREPVQIAEHQTAPALIAPTVDGREVVLTGSGDFLAFRHVDGLTDEQVSDIMNTRRAEVEKYRSNWARYSLTETVKRLLPNANAKAIANTSKIYYTDDNTPVEIVYDSMFDYFRIQARGSRRQIDYRDINGNVLPNNVTLANGKQRGRTKSERMVETHFDNTDYRG